MESLAAVLVGKVLLADFIEDFCSYEIGGRRRGGDGDGGVGIFAGEDGMPLLEMEFGAGEKGFCVLGMGGEIEVDAVEGLLWLAEVLEVDGIEELCAGILRIHRKNFVKVGGYLGVLTELTVGLCLEKEDGDGGGGVGGVLEEAATVVEGLLGVVEGEGADGAVAAGLEIGGVLAEDEVKFFGGFVEF